MSEQEHAAERFTDDELAFLRHARFGELPPRIAPEQRTASTETEPPRYLPEPEPPVVSQG